MKKFISFLMVFVMIIAMNITAFAAQDTNANNGKITINNAIVGQDYTIYKILDLESYNPVSKAYSYKVTEAWRPFIEGSTVKDIYLKTDKQGYVTWVQDAKESEFAKLAVEYAKTLSQNQGSKTATTTVEGAEKTTVEFTGLELGYYLRVSTVGALCSLNTTDPDVIMNEKNEKPTIHKLVLEDSDNSWNSENTAQVGDVVDFKTTVHSREGAIQYKVHDKMSEGLTFDPNSVVVEKHKPVTREGGTGTSAETQVTTLVKDVDYTVTMTGLDDDCTFHVDFIGDSLKDIENNTSLVVTYSAKLNEKAVVKPQANTNLAKLQYGQNTNITTEGSETKIYTLKFDLVKTDSKRFFLDGAKFELYDAATGGNKIPLKKNEDGSYIIATEGVNEAGFTSAVIETQNGQALIKGMDANTNYYLEEIEAPAGYNKLHERVKVIISESNLDAVVNLENKTYTKGGVHVINNAGSELPTTGGVGTTLFYVIGGILAVGAAVLLVVKRRMREN